jgi:peptidoglycan/LPS O-acetylase OafA/YrhL
MIYFLEVLSAKPLAAFSAMVFWSFFVLLFHPHFRQWFNSIFFSTTTTTHIQSFDALRGLAALGVFLGHIFHWSYPIFKDVQLSFNVLAYISNKAVPVFAMLSAYLICRQLSISYTEPSIQNIRRYFSRRFFRIYPLYFFCFILFCIVSRVYYTHEDIKPLSFMMSDLLMFRVFGASVYANPVTWSLYVEVFFYLVAPLIVWGIPRKMFLSAITIIFLALVIGDQGSGSKEFWLIKYFLLGMMAFELPRKYLFLQSSFLGYFFVAVGAIFFLFDLNGPACDIFSRLPLVSKSPGNFYTIGLGLSFGCMLIGLPYAPIVARLLSIKPLLLLGLISYSLYLLHPIYLMLNFSELQNTIQFRGKVLSQQFSMQQPLPNWYFWGVLMVGLIPWATLSYLFIERPFLRINLKSAQLTYNGKEKLTSRGRGC